MEASEYSAAIVRANKANDLYAVLNVARGVDVDAVKRAYKAHAMQLHPDRNDQPGAEDAFKKLLEAYVVLSNAKHRAAYDSECASQRVDDSKGKRKTAQKAKPPTAEERAAQRELDELLARAYQQERHTEWVRQARYEQSSAVLAVFGMLLFLVVGTFGWLLFVVWPADDSFASGPQPLQPTGWSAALGMKLRFFASLIVRVVLAVLALILVICASPYALGFGMFCTGKLCEWIFDGFGFLGRKLGPLVEAYVMSRPSGRVQAGGRRRK